MNNLNTTSGGKPPTTSWRRRIRTWWFTFTGNTVLVVATVALGLLASVVGWLPPRGHWMYRVARLWSRLLLASSGVSVRCEFEAPLDGSQGYVVMANHQSLYDIPVLLATLPCEARFLAKRSLFRIPIFGWALYAGGFIPVDRKKRDKKRSGSAFEAAMARLGQGRSILLFPEQTRSPDGALLPFRRGGFLMALKSGLPILPVGIDGTLEVRARKSLEIEPGTVSICYGEPIDAGAYGAEGLTRLMADVRQRLEELRT